MKPKRQTTGKVILVIITLLALSSCASFFSQNSTKISLSAKDYLEKAAQASGIESQQYQILAINQLIEDNNINDAEQLIKTFNNMPLSPSLIPQKSIVDARLALKQNKPRLAINRLSTITRLNGLPEPILNAYYTTKTEAYLRNNKLAASTIALINFNSIISDSARIQENNNTIWCNLQTLKLSTLNLLLSQQNTLIVQGWLKLAIIAKQKANNPSQLAVNIQQWQVSNPGHPANTLLPSADVLQTLSTPQNPKQIALLIPLHGPFGKMGQAIQDGFMTAFYANAKTLPQTPTIKIYDTSQSENITDIENQALQEGADFIVGPLTKSNVNKIIDDGNKQVPTLTLNYSDESSIPNNFIQLGFSPEQAAEQITFFAWQHGATKSLIITPNNDWGNQVSKSFNTHWLAVGGSVVNELNFDDNNQLPSEISNALSITDSVTRTTELSQLLGEKLKSTPRRRRDINSIFLAATPQEARQIIPLLRFYYAGDIPVFSIANIYTGYPAPRNDHDLNGIYFDDMPWIIKNSPTIDQFKRTILSLWKNNYQNNSRLYGLGIDAFTISTLYSRLLALPNFAIHGVTGQIFLQPDHTVYQQLYFARFSQGIPQSINQDSGSR